MPNGTNNPPPSQPAAPPPPAATAPANRSVRRQKPKTGVLKTSVCLLTGLVGVGLGYIFIPPLFITKAPDSDNLRQAVAGRFTEYSRGKPALAQLTVADSDCKQQGSKFSRDFACHFDINYTSALTPTIQGESQGDVVITKHPNGNWGIKDEFAKSNGPFPKRSFKNHGLVFDQPDVR